jgi:hypothetical protein
MQNAVAQMRHNLNSSAQPSESEGGSAPHFEYNIVGVQKTAEKIRSSNVSSSNNVSRPQPVENQFNILIENGEYSGRKKQLFPTAQKLGEIGKIRLPELRTPQGLSSKSFKVPITAQQT